MYLIVWKKQKNYMSQKNTKNERNVSHLLDPYIKKGLGLSLGHFRSPSVNIKVEFRW
jgi:hypothetical protein